MGLQFFQQTAAFVLVSFSLPFPPFCAEERSSQSPISRSLRPDTTLLGKKTIEATA